MNILGDFITRVNDRYPLDIDNEELNSLLTTIKNQGDELALKDKEIEKLHNMIGRLDKGEEAPAAKPSKPAAKKAPAKKAAPKAEEAAKPAAPKAKKAPAKKAAPKKAEPKAEV